MVALRGGPGKQFGIVDRYDTGRQVELLNTWGEWSEVRDTFSQRTGWISTRLLAERKPEEDAQREDPTPKEGISKPALPPALISDTVIIQRLIAESISMYPGLARAPTIPTEAVAAVGSEALTTGWRLCADLLSGRRLQGNDRVLPPKRRPVGGIPRNESNRRFRHGLLDGQTPEMKALDLGFELVIRESS
ncbi:SH3 domain-containing protein [Rhizobium tibeticum]|nr:SH3 domain-containing protein [Rhizobium tibeticum]